MLTVMLIGALWVAFAGMHVWLSSSGLRPRLVDGLGAQPFQGLYSLVALATFVPLVGFFMTHKHAGPLLWTTLGPAVVARGASQVLMGLALVLLVASLLPGGAAPSAMQARGPARAQGVTRVTRHPMLAAFGLFGVAHLLVNGSLGDVIFFGGFPLFTRVGGHHQDGRKAHEVRGYDELIATTSILPFGAIAAGRQRLVARELPLAAIAIGLALTVVLRTYHGALFGP
jgi:uncharacterized membrane protein